jgi:Mn-dependent DtxR family transcriptional regulator
MPSTKRERTVAAAVLGVVLQGVFFDPQMLRDLGFHKSMVSRVLHSLAEAGVIEQIDGSKFLMTKEFKEMMKRRITMNMPRDTFLSFPDRTIFDICGIEHWNDEEMDGYVERLREYRASLLKRKRL